MTQTYPPFWDSERETMPVGPARRRSWTGSASSCSTHTRTSRSTGSSTTPTASGPRRSPRWPSSGSGCRSSPRTCCGSTRPPTHRSAYHGTAMTEVGRVFGSSGTTGTPTLYGVSKADWERARDAQGMAMWAMGVRPDDVVHFVFPFGMFMGGWALLLGAEAVGATCFTPGAMDTRRQIEMMLTLRPSVLAGTPSYCMHLGEVATEMGVDLRQAGLRLAVVGGEPGGSLQVSRHHQADLRRRGRGGHREHVGVLPDPDELVLRPGDRPARLRGRVFCEFVDRRPHYSRPDGRPARRSTRRSGAGRSR